MTRWHGTTTAIGLAPFARPTAAHGACVTDARGQRAVAQTWCRRGIARRAFHTCCWKGVPFVAQSMRSIAREVAGEVASISFRTATGARPSAMTTRGPYC